MSRFKVNYNVEKDIGEIVIEAVDLDDAYSKMSEALFEKGFDPTQVAKALINVKNIKTGENFCPHPSAPKLIPVSKQPMRR